MRGVLLNLLRTVTHRATRGAVLLLRLTNHLEWAKTSLQGRLTRRDCPIVGSEAPAMVFDNLGNVPAEQLLPL